MTQHRHDTLVAILSDRLMLNGLYEKISDHEEYKTKKKCGEIDLYAIRGDRLFIFEMKCNLGKKNYTKAIDQLHRAEEYCFPEFDRVYKFIVSYADKKGKDYIIQRIV